MLLSRNIKMALASLGSNKMRSFLTMLGIIIGVVSVVTTVSLGEGVRQEVIGQIKSLGPDLITIQPGKTVTKDTGGNITGVTLLPNILPNTLTEADLVSAKSVAGVKDVLPIALATGVPAHNDQSYPNAIIIATTDQAPMMLNQRVEFGEFFGPNDGHKHVAVIGKRVAEQLFEENVPIGKAFVFRNQQYIVRGVMEEYESSPFGLTIDFNNAIFMPFDSTKQVAAGNLQIYQILVKAAENKAAAKVVHNLETAIGANHAGQTDFTVLRSDQSLTVANRTLNLLTGLTAGIAAISLIVGGIGIMNIMLVSVTERTREVGIRKAVGATNKQILSQFMTEAVVLSVVAGIIGVLISGLINYLLRISTDLKPVITLPVVCIAFGVSIIVGIIFGIAPAWKAAKKDPIEALRYE